jgi:hypothetical protein
VYTGLLWGGLREGDHLQDPDVAGRIILKCICRIWEGIMYWIDEAQDRDRWMVFLNVVMNIRVP